MAENSIHKHVNSCSEWKEITESRMEKYSFDKIPKEEIYTGIQREDGLTLIREGQNRERFETFLCKGSFGEFKFLAQRWDTKRNKYTDLYIVQTKVFPSKLPLDIRVNEKLILDHLEAIECGLLNYPSGESYGFRQAKEVLFELNLPSQGSNLAHAEEIQHA